MNSVDPAGIAISSTKGSEPLTQFARRYPLVEPSQAEFLLVDTEQGLQLTWQSGLGKALHYSIDVEKFAARQASFPAAKQAGLNQALGKKTCRVIDATAGWAGDALLMCAQGYQLSLIERHPLMALLLKDAMRRLAETEWARQHKIGLLPVIEGDAIELLSTGKLQADCVYLDPMFPPKRNKSAAPNKNMQLLQRLVGKDLDCAQLVSAAVSAGYHRIVVKRPSYATPIYPQPSMQFSSKLVHYDVYLTGS